LVEAIESRRYDAIVCNYANGDMVGHTGNLAAATRAIEVLDECIGRIEIAGMHSKVELAEWAAKADSEEGMADWFHILLKQGQLPKVQALIEAEPGLLAAVLPIVGNVEASLNVRLGAGVLFEEFAGSDALRALLPRLGELSQHEDARVRADACHYLGLTGDALAKPWLETRLDDADADVREIAGESLAVVGGA
jgi:HEAT repeat protein